MMNEETEKQYLFEKILAMNTVMRSLNDEDYLFRWLELGVPDGTETLQDVKDVYDGTLEEVTAAFDELAELFAKIVRAATNDGVKKWIC